MHRRGSASPHTPGVYHLVMRLDRARSIRVGRLGVFRFRPGYYVYTGSALSGLEPRIARHRRRRKRLRWHIDYLLGHARILDVIAVATERRIECERNRRVLAMEGARVPVKDFGASDCRCPAHLAWFRQSPTAELESEYGSGLQQSRSSRRSSGGA